MKRGRIILLNGASSSGKTSIARELQKLLEEPYMRLGIDTVFAMIPEKCKCGDLERLKAFVWVPKHKASPEVHISVGYLGHKVMTGFHRACVSICSAGINMIIDHVLFDPRWTEECFEMFSPFAVCFVGVWCPVDVLETRERERGDRQIGLARFTAAHAHTHLGQGYDLVVDTSASSPEECAKQIIRHISARYPSRIQGPSSLVGSTVQTHPFVRMPRLRPGMVPVWA